MAIACVVKLLPGPPNHGRPPVTVSGPGILDVTYWQQKNSLTVHLVNLTNPMMMKGPIREILPVGEQSLVLRLPGTGRVREARLLVAGTTIPYRQVGQTLELRVPSIALHEVVAIDV